MREKQSERNPFEHHLSKWLSKLSVNIIYSSLRIFNAMTKTQISVSLIIEHKSH